ncbi:hypothetical protein LAZ67_5002668 [Cordylochernes scorpioides]|uniref:Histone-lysine N-methyltransferase SETMAR n=1 Tax=Cordylochernes scorpioides TaxID=51811 RepID=A0ABY6KK39_9ARAC|nr:hypothetical protein LAZ67_5002668 [Cordylochernes scorpioides]
MRRGTTINSDRYCETIKQLRRAIQNKSRGMLNKGVRFHHDNTRPHTALIKKFRCELVSHPPYSPDVAPSDFHLFPELKKNLGGTQFQDDDEKEGKTCMMTSEEAGPLLLRNNAAAAAVRNVVEADRRVTIDEILIRLLLESKLRALRLEQSCQIF